MAFVDLRLKQPGRCFESTTKDEPLLEAVSYLDACVRLDSAYQSTIRASVG